MKSIVVQHKRPKSGVRRDLQAECLADRRALTKFVLQNNNQHLRRPDIERLSDARFYELVRLITTATAAAMKIKDLVRLSPRHPGRSR